MFGLTKYFCTNVSLLCTVGSVDVFFIDIFESYLNKFALGPLIPDVYSVRTNMNTQEM